MKTHYDLIGVKKDATQDEIRKAYLALAKKLHPDKTGGDKAAETELKEINAAYDTLKDKRKRAEYDLSLNPPQPGHSSGFGSMMHDMFVRKRGKFAPQDMQVIVTLSLEEAFTGCTKNVVYQRPVKCEHCNGTGGEDYSTCSACNGSGMIHSMSGMTQISRTCGYCGGRGGKVLRPCTKCNSVGHTSEEKTISVDIPPGVDTGYATGIQKEGIFGGNLIIIIQMKPHEKFVRDGHDVMSEEKIPLTMALLGGEILARTLHGTVSVKVPEGANIGQVLRLKGQGMSSQGDHHLVLNIDIPKTLSDRAKELTRELEKELTDELVK